jgi:hypothetical protein
MNVLGITATVSRTGSWQSRGSGTTVQFIERCAAQRQITIPLSRGFVQHGWRLHFRMFITKVRTDA